MKYSQNKKWLNQKKVQTMYMKRYFDDYNSLVLPVSLLGNSGLTLPQLMGM